MNQSKMEFKDTQVIPLVIRSRTSPRTCATTEHAGHCFWLEWALPKVLSSSTVHLKSLKCTRHCQSAAPTSAQEAAWTYLSKCDRFVPRNIICIFTSKHSTITPIQLLRNLLKPNKQKRGRGKISLQISLVSF